MKMVDSEVIRKQVERSACMILEYLRKYPSTTFVEQLKQQCLDRILADINAEKCGFEAQTIIIEFLLALEDLQASGESYYLCWQALKKALASLNNKDGYDGQ